MFGSVVLDVAIGMVFVYLLLSLVAAVVQEILATFMQLRSANLEIAIRSLFSGDSLWGKSLVDSIYSHGLIRGLYLDPQKDLGATTAGRLQPIGDWIRGVLRWSWFGIEPKGEVKDVDTGQTPSKYLLPAYIPSRAFAQALIGVLNTENKAGVEAMASIQASLAAHHWTYRANKAGQAMLALATAAEGDLGAFEQGLEHWYADAMDRASAWYKKYTQRMLLVTGLVLAVVLNVDTIRVIGTLWVDRDARQAMVEAAGKFDVKQPEAAKPQEGTGKLQEDAAKQPQNQNQDQNKDTNQAKKLDDLEEELQQRVTDFQSITQNALLPVGWKRPFWDYGWTDVRSNPDKVFHKLVGWLITGLAISLGAPFWFDLLNKFMVVRSTVKPQEKSRTEGSKD